MSRVLLVPAVLVAALVAGCVEEARPSSCASDAIEIEVALSATAMIPSAPAVCQGQRVTLLVESELDAVFHIHGYDEAVPATRVDAGETTAIEFVADREGQFPVEIHAADDARGVEVGIFTVHAT